MWTKIEAEKTPKKDTVKTNMCIREKPMHKTCGKRCGEREMRQKHPLLPHKIREASCSRCMLSCSYSLSRPFCLFHSFFHPFFGAWPRSAAPPLFFFFFVWSALAPFSSRAVQIPHPCMLAAPHRGQQTVTALSIHSSFALGGTMDPLRAWSTGKKIQKQSNGRRTERKFAGQKDPHARYVATRGQFPTCWPGLFLRELSRGSGAEDWGRGEGQ
jgi:hypothetical protein